MSIKKKIILSNALMLIIPLMLVMIIAGVIAFWSVFLPENIQTPSVEKFIENFIKKYGLFLIACSIIIATAVNITLTFYLSKSITKPIRELQLGTYKIIGGDLNFEIISSEYKEINELCAAFEDMRIKMKESITKQTKYDHDRNMLIANISHDLKTPITSIKGYAEGILDGIADTPFKLDKYVKTIYGKSVIIEKLVENLLLFSKLELKKVPFNLESINITTILKDLIEVYYLDITENNIKIILNMQEKENYYVICDREKISRVFNNLIENSIKYRKNDGGIIEIILTKANNGIIVEIKDNGTGINQEHLPYVFECFYRFVSSPNQNIKGNGLGLAISKQIVEGHKGKIWIKSSENIGTSVFVFLPSKGEV